MFLPALLPARQHGPPDGGRTLFRGASIDHAILAEGHQPLRGCNPQPSVWGFNHYVVATVTRYEHPG